MIGLTQRIGQSILMQVEKGFNAVFGSALNPLYQLGAISFFLFWVVLGSGFYIYAFYETGVNIAYSSVERITHEQWYLGGIMRSLHRYASDAMVVTVLLHLLRNFVMDRFTGFRAFSWITGIILLLLLYISGLNGYFLVWDRLAQFIAVASTEWLDWLPIFSSPLSRNFLTPDSINDRFFSLLSFVHLGVPLAMLVFIMIHTQRVVEAKTNPSKQLAIGLGLTLLVLSIVKPALSQGGPADLGMFNAQLGLDWFYLGLYPLMYMWSPAELWGLVGGILAFLLLLPVLRWNKKFKQGFKISTVPSEHSFTAKPGETILEAALHHEVHIPYACRNGACGRCKGSVLHGTVDYGEHLESALTEDEKRKGLALFCCAKPLSDIEIEYYEDKALAQVPVRMLQCSVHKMERVAPSVMLLDLKLPQDSNLKFYAGQYLNIVLDDGSRRAFSFANAPHDDEFLQLHIRHIPGGKFTTHVFTQMKEGDTLNIEGPLGSFYLHDDGEKPIIFVAGATGFAPVKSMLEHAFHTGSKRRMYLYWGVRVREDLYEAELPERWQREHDNFSFVPVLSEAAPDSNWQGRTGLVHEAVLKDFPDLSGFQIYACGSMKMVQAAQPAFLAQGLRDDECFSDAFTMSAHQTVQPAAEVKS